MEMSFSMSTDVYSDHLIGLEKLPQNGSCPNPSIGSQDILKSISMSVDLHSHSCFDLTFGLALKNYPKLTLHLSRGGIGLAHKQEKLPKYFVFYLHPPLTTTAYNATKIPFFWF